MGKEQFRGAPATLKKIEYRTERKNVHDLGAQDEFINKMVNDGWEFVESVNIYGNEILLRFKR
jgi:hypothetical protein